MAKELSMVERNDKGKQARQYFIECERRAKSAVATLPDFTDPAAAAIAWAEQFRAKQLAVEQVAVLAIKVEQDAPKVAFHDQVVVMAGAITLAETAKIIGTGWTRYRQAQGRDFSCHPRRRGGGTKWARATKCSYSIAHPYTATKRNVTI